MSELPVRVTLRLADPALSDRLAALLDGVAGIELVAANGDADAALVSVSLSGGEGRDENRFALSPREHEVLALMAEGASNKEIARRLGISVHTAKFHVGSLLDKLDATGRTDAVAHAARIGVLHL